MRYLTYFTAMALVFIVGIAIVTSSSSCTHNPYIPDNIDTTHTPVDTSATCSPDTVYFVNTVLPIIQTNCAKSGCHDAASHQEGYDLSSYNSIMASRSVVSGNPSQSFLYYVITTTGGDRMPQAPNDPLTADQINTISTWILQGAQNNVCTANTCDTTNVTYANVIQPMLSTYCYACHSENNKNSGGGVSLENFSELQGYATNGTLLCDINHGNTCNAMPQGANKLSDCNIAKISTWINAGAPNN